MAFSKTISLKARFTFLLLISFCFVFSAAARKSVSLGTYGDWRAFELFDKKTGKKTCYAISYAVGITKPDKKADYITITHYGKIEKDVFLMHLSTPFKKTETIKPIFGKSTSVELFASGDTAMAEGPRADKKIVGLMKQKPSISISRGKGRGKKKVKFSLMGFSKAYEGISRACRA